MASFKDLTGQRFGRLECVQGIKQRRAKDGVIWECKCDCGRHIHVREKLLIEGLKTSCSCVNDKENKVYFYNVKNMVAQDKPEILTLKLKVGRKIGIFFYDNNHESKAEIHVIKKVDSSFVTLKDGTRYNNCGKEVGAVGLLATYLCTVEQAEHLISKQQQRILDKANEKKRTIKPQSKNSQRSKPIILEKLHHVIVQKPQTSDVIVDYLQKHGGATCTQIATNINVGVNAVTCILNQLIKKGLVNKALPKQNGQAKQKSPYTFFLVNAIDNNETI